MDAAAPHLFPQHSPDKASQTIYRTFPVHCFVMLFQAHRFQQDCTCLASPVSM
jgi:hypothetical protein